ncbi:hypothetical protein L1987_79716 [Smallanthus sonchifolius]|uniref:Uncharacterized protein n=1 Tax=Smallanthus sonchifolius TaxID=185202 RepID=A0ACB8YKQ3_9ASTR|nr:hypothetical protein L1987_79716 [Smallanthus sonchifolius]
MDKRMSGVWKNIAKIDKEIQKDFDPLLPSVAFRSNSPFCNNHSGRLGVKKDGKHRKNPNPFLIIFTRFSLLSPNSTLLASFIKCLDPSPPHHRRTHH